jgi:hypothetical protein
VSNKWKGLNFISHQKAGMAASPFFQRPKTDRTKRAISVRVALLLFSLLPDRFKNQGITDLPEEGMNLAEVVRFVSRMHIFRESFAWMG